MSITRIYYPIDLASLLHQHLVLPLDITQHLGTVLRKKQGQYIIIFNGQGGEYTAEITQIHRQKITLVLQSFHPQDRESALTLQLAQCISKPIHFDFTLQKSVELGVTEIWPILSERSEPLSGKTTEQRIIRWQKIITHACEQSGRTRLPILHPPTLLSVFSKQPGGITLFLEPTAQTRFSELKPILQKKNPPITEPVVFKILCGPEGGFSNAEKALLTQLNCIPLRLGPRILRTETAGICMLSLIQGLWGDF
jgi:16S rRNA (uracil1498-N3)-methyltransferase